MSEYNTHRKRAETSLTWFDHSNWRYHCSGSCIKLLRGMNTPPAARAAAAACASASAWHSGSWRGPASISLGGFHPPLLFGDATEANAAGMDEVWLNFCSFCSFAAWSVLNLLFGEPEGDSVGPGVELLAGGLITAGFLTVGVGLGFLRWRGGGLAGGCGTFFVVHLAAVLTAVGAFFGGTSSVTTSSISPPAPSPHSASRDFHLEVFVNNASSFQLEESWFQPSEASFQLEESWFQPSEAYFQSEESWFQPSESSFQLEESWFQPSESSFQFEESSFQFEALSFQAVSVQLEPPPFQAWSSCHVQPQEHQDLSSLPQPSDAAMVYFCKQNDMIPSPQQLLVKKKSRESRWTPSNKVFFNENG